MSEWRHVTLADVAEVVPGYAFKGEDFGDTGTPIIKIKDIVPPRINIEEAQKVNLENYPIERLAKQKLRQGDFVVAMTGATIGKMGRLTVDAEAYINQRVAKILPFDNVEKNFIYYAVIDPSFDGFIQNNIDSQSAQENISGTSIGRFPVLLPQEPAEQKAIAGVLSCLDDKIDLLHRQNKTLEAMAETLFRQWFIVEAKEDWEEGSLGAEFDFTMGQSPVGSSFNEDGVGVPMFQGNADFEFRFPCERIYTTEPTRFAKKMDTLISVRAPVGAQNMAHRECCIGRGVAAFRYKKNNGYYTYTYFKLRSLMKEIQKFNDEGTVFGSISKSDFDRLVTVIPPVATITLFEQVAKPINDRVIENCAQIKTLEKLRDTLLPKLMNGEVRVACGT